eukprot:m.221691 g.221691  ORF g.221691 m.221691 type:complete len:519 (+) comp18723_c0_seq1:189-1745(+)
MESFIRCLFVALAIVGSVAANSSPQAQLATTAAPLPASTVAATTTKPPATTKATVISDGGAQAQFFGPDSTQAFIAFESYVYMERPEHLEGDHSPKELLSERWELIVKAVVTRQLEHMFGAFLNFPEFKDAQGAPSMGGKINLLDAKNMGKMPTHVKVSYSYKDQVVFHHDTLGIRQDKTIKFWLPADPKTIYAKGLVEQADGQVFNFCTDMEYNAKIDFWYFWNPFLPGCPLDMDEDLTTIKAKLTSVPQTKKTYPEYDMLLGDNGNGKTLLITWVIGMDEFLVQGDLGYDNFDLAHRLLVLEQFEVTLDTEFFKIYKRSYPQFDIVVELSFEDQFTKQFTERVVDSMRRADLFIYDGHSGLGGHLDVRRMEEELGRPIVLDKTKYQIFFLNGCATFSYYNAAFTELKKDKDRNLSGKKYLDLVGTAVGAILNNGAFRDWSLIVNLIYRQKTWQKALKDVTGVDIAADTALVHINNDEDNPKKRSRKFKKLKLVTERNNNRRRRSGRSNNYEIVVRG